MKYSILLILIFPILFLISCGEQETNNLNTCNKINSRENAVELMNEIHNDRILDSIEIKKKLIGNWGLIAIVPGWVGFEAGQECISLSITENKIELIDLLTGSSSSTDWKLIHFEVNGYSGFYLQTNEDVWNNRIGMEVFSDNFIYGTGRIDDGNTYIYEKQK